MKQRIRIPNKEKTARIYRPLGSFADLVFHMRDHGGKTAFMWNAREGEEKDGSINYELFAEEIELAAAALYTEGFSGKRIAFLGNPSVTYAAFMIAALSVGAVIVPIDCERTTEEVATLLRRADVCALFYGASVKADIEALTKSRSLRLVCAMENALPMPDSKRARRYADLMLSGVTAVPRGESFSFPTVEQDAPAAMLFTSGTAGESKCAVLSVKNLLSAINGACASVDLEKADLLLSLLPFHHSYQLSTLFVLFNYGVTVVLNDGQGHFCANLQKYRPTGLVLVPLYVGLLYTKLCEESKQVNRERGFHYGIKASNILLNLGIDVRERMLSRIREFFGGRLTKIVSGGAPLNPKLIYAYESLGIAVYEGYGVTECGPFITMTPYYARRVGSVGKALPGMHIRIDSAEGVKGEHGYEEGEIEVKGDSVMKGYDRDESANEAAFTLDGYFRTGDIGYLDKDGYLFVTGRKKSVIVLDNGRNVAPEELEEYLCDLPDIEEAMVFAKRDDKGTLHLYATILPTAAFSEDKEEDVLFAECEEMVAQINARLPLFKQIEQISLTKTPFPRNSLGKLIRNFVG